MQLRCENSDANIQAFANDVGGDTWNERFKDTDSLRKARSRWAKGRAHITN